MRYRIQELLGAGGMGQVYRAWDPVLDRPVALKYLRGRDPAQTRRMLREARAQASVDHEHVCRVYETGEMDGKAFVAMQYVDGSTLAEATDEMSVREKVEVLRRVAEAVQAAHSRGLIHRDLKPGNVLVERTEGLNGERGWHPYVVDFGLALDEEAPALTTEGRIVGTPAYMAPEQVEGTRESLDRRVDVYALGATAYQVLSGEPPFRGDSKVDVWMKVLRDEPTPLGRIDPSIPEDLRIIVEHCLEKDPDRRYDSARLLAEDLDRFLAGAPILARPPSLLYRARRRIARHKALAAVSAVAAVLIVALLAAGVVREVRARERTRLAQRFGQEAERLAGFARMVHLAPLHDIRSEVAALRERMDRLQKERNRLGTVAAGPGSFALGASALGLGELEEARGHLERAWEAGFRDPRVAVALGRTHGELYRRAIAVLRHLEPDLFQVESAEARERHLDPAVRFLRAGLESEERSTPYLEALLAFYEDDLERAEARALAALEREPFLYEAALLRADIDVERGFRAELDQDLERARELYRSAGEATRRAMEIGRSDPATYEAECRRHTRLVAIRTDLDEFAVPAACTYAVAVHPERATAFEARAEVLAELTSDAEAQGREFADLMERTVEDARRALELDPDLIGARMALAEAHRSRAARLETEDRDAMKATRAGIEVLEGLVERQPFFVPALADLGASWARHAYALEDQGEDPEHAYREAFKHYREAARLAPSLGRIHARLGLTLSAYGERLQRRGEDPEETFHAAERALERARELQPDNGLLLGVLGYNAWAWARWEWATGGDAAPHFDRAAEWFDRAIELAPSYALTLFNQALMHVVYTDYLLGRGRLDRVAEVLGTARRATRELAALSPEQALCMQADVAVGSARLALARGEDPGEHLRRSLDVVSEGAGAERTRCRRVEVEAHRLMAAWRAERGLAPEGHIEDGLEVTEDLLEFNPEDSVTLEQRALLFLERARWSDDPGERSAAARKALETFERFLEASPTWAESTRPLIEEARRLAGTEDGAGDSTSAS